MRRFKFGRRRSSFRRFNRARKIVRAVSGIVLAKRVILNETIPDVTTVDYDNPLTFDLAACAEAMDEEIESTGGTTAGTDVATVPLYSRLIGMRLNLTVVGPASSTVAHRWLLYKKPDNEQNISTATMLTDTGFHISDDTVSLRDYRKYQMSKGMLFTNASTGVTPLKIFVKKQAMHRVSPMRENDRISFAIAKDATGISSTLHGFGTLWFKANA